MARLEFILLLSPALFFSFFSSFLLLLLLLSSSSIAPKSDSDIGFIIALSVKFCTFSYIFRTFLHFYLHNSKFFRIFALVFSPRRGYVLRLWEGCGHIKGVFLRFVLAFRNLANSN